VVTYVTPANLPTEIDTYDFGAASPTQKELIAYASIVNGANNRVSCDQVLVGTSAPGSCGTVTSNTKSLSTAAYDSLGNLKSAQAWAQGSQYLGRSFTYYSNGLLETSTDVNGTSTTYGYQNCNNTPAYMSQVTSGGLSTSLTWDCNGGVVTQWGDFNQQNTSFGFLTPSGIADPFWRVLSVKDPLGNVTWNTYTTAPPTKETALAFNNNSSGSDVVLTFDGLGRLVTSQVRTAPGSTTFDNTVQYGYGWNSVGPVTGPVFTQTIPGGTALTTQQLDALGRMASVTDGGGGVMTMTYPQNDVLRTVGPHPTGESSKQRQIEYDVFGRITSVCEITSSLPGYGTCTQTSSTPNGYFTRYAYDNPINSVTATQNATGSTQTRIYQYDGVGRLVSETNPEWGPGTTNYAYDSDTTCGTSNGDLVKKVDPGNNVTCYAYDALHRVTGKSYPSGPYSASTPSKTFVYDATTFSCANPNVKGQLAEAFTGPSSAKITDIAFCYSPRGENTDVFESTPNSKGYYHTTANYWANGALNVLGGVPSHNAWTFNIDGEGRPFSAVDGTMTNLAVSTSYNAASQPTGVILGSGDSDTYTYDANTGRMATYEYNIGSTPKYVTGTLGWNPNWTLGSLVISDAFDSANAQTCGYLHDDLARLQSVECGPTNPDGTTWGQTFSYDPFGNITKSGTSSFIPVYTGATGTGTNPTNQFYQLPGGPTGTSHYYDATGNLTSDLTNTYAWDADGDTVGINVNGSSPISITYDAFDRAVEQNNSGTYKQVLYSPIGKLALMTKQSTANVFLPLPGGEQVTYSAQTIRFRHYDWLGSARFESNMSEQEYGDVAYAPFGETYSIKNTPYTSFTGQNQDTIAGLYDFLYREDSPVQGRWLRPDPAGVIAIDPSNPQTLNKYAYVSNQPLEAVDPVGQCTIFVGGVNDTNTTLSFVNAAASVGGVIVAPYANDGTLGGVLDVAAQAILGPNASSQDVAAEVNAIENDPNGIQVVAFSGGAQAFSSAVDGNLIDSNALGSINQVVYLSPGIGPGTTLAFGGSAFTSTFHGHGIMDFFATIFSHMSGQAGSSLPCSHNFDCEFNSLPSSIKSKFTPCPTAGTRGGGGDLNGGYDFSGGEWVFLSWEFYDFPSGEDMGPYGGWFYISWQDLIQRK
jgi:RHS repeat-associated protein